MQAVVAVEIDVLVVVLVGVVAVVYASGGTVVVLEMVVVEGTIVVGG